MAITIRNVEEHEKMLSELKLLTQKNTMSSSLLHGGYLALEYQDKYQRQCIENTRLLNELYSLKSKVSSYVSALDDLRS